MRTKSATLSAQGAQRLRLPGLALAGVTAAISGVSVFVNSYALHHVPRADVYTTVKNLVAAFVIAGVLLGASALRRSDKVRPSNHSRAHLGLAQIAALAYIGIVGGGVAFILGFDGMAKINAVSAAFMHDTLVIWVAIFAAVFLFERISAWNIAAVVVLIGGAVVISGGIGDLSPSSGLGMELGATVLWGVEVVVAKRVMARVTPRQVALVRMGGGSLVLVAYLALNGALHGLFALTMTQLGWALFTGLLLAAYVGTWLPALARARAIDVSSILVASAFITTLLNAATGHPLGASTALGLSLFALGIAAVSLASRRSRLPNTTATPA